MHQEWVWAYLIPGPTLPHMGAGANLLRRSHNTSFLLVCCLILRGGVIKYICLSVLLVCYLSVCLSLRGADQMFDTRWWVISPRWWHSHIWNIIIKHVWNQVMGYLITGCTVVALPIFAIIEVPHLFNRLFMCDKSQICDKYLKVGRRYSNTTELLTALVRPSKQWGPNQYQVNLPCLFGCFWYWKSTKLTFKT